VPGGAGGDGGDGWGRVLVGVRGELAVIFMYLLDFGCCFVLENLPILQMRHLVR